MKCKKCGAVWTPGKASITLPNCPFCGEPLVIGQKSKEKTLDMVLKELIDRFGMRILQEPERCIAIFMDIAPSLRKERKVLEVVLNAKVDKFFISCPIDERKKNVIRAMQEIDFLNDESKRLIISAFVKALQWDETLLQDLFPEKKQEEVVKEDLEALYQEGKKLAEAKDYENCKLDAENGDAESQYKLANCYLNGIGVKKNNLQAFIWFKKAAEQDHAKAQYELGNCYMNWIGTSKDVNKACYWYERSALNGNLEAKKKFDLIKFKRSSQRPWAEKYDYEKQYSGMIQNPGHVPDFITKYHSEETESYFKKSSTQSQQHSNTWQPRRNDNVFYQRGFKQYNDLPKKRNTKFENNSRISEELQTLPVTNPMILETKVNKINVKIGDKIKTGDVIAELESYGLIYEIISSADGIVKNILVKKGDIIKNGNIIIMLNQV